ncbi:MAG: hypothetical protein LBS42_05690 [Tannerella sp.]|jgi:hypothetical protein|nr:hypothetical protein [Tannerella sp.]
MPPKETACCRILARAGLFFSLFASRQNKVLREDIGQGGSMARFTINGNHLYTEDNSRLHEFDISRTDNPVYLPQKVQYMEAGIETVFSMDTLLFIG